MGKTKSVYVCQQCGAESSKWLGQCRSCGQWNTFVEQRIPQRPSRSAAGEKGAPAPYARLEEVVPDQVQRIDLKNGEFNRVLGGRWRLKRASLPSKGPEKRARSS